MQVSAIGGGGVVMASRLARGNTVTAGDVLDGMSLIRRRTRMPPLAIHAGSAGRLLIDPGHPNLAMTCGCAPGLSAEDLNCAGAGDSEQACHEATEEPADPAPDRVPGQYRCEHEQRTDFHSLTHDQGVQNVILDLGIDNEYHEGNDPCGN
jgi:hypothetical protein